MTPDPWQCAVCLAWFPVRVLARDHETRHEREPHWTPLPDRKGRR